MNSDDDDLLYPPTQWFTEPTPPNQRAIQEVTAPTVIDRPAAPSPQVIVVEHWIMAPTQQRTRPQRAWAWLTPKRWLSICATAFLIEVAGAYSYQTNTTPGKAAGLALMLTGIVLWIAGLLITGLRWMVPLPWRIKIRLTRAIIVTATVVTIAGLGLVAVAVAGGATTPTPVPHHRGK